MFTRLLSLFALALVTLALADSYVLRYFELTQLSHTPGEVILSPDYQTIIEFQDLTVDTVSTGRSDQMTIEIDAQMIRLRANQDVVNTDLTVKVGGKTVLFTLKADPTRRDANRYLVLNK
jgi:hypothetical protein